MSRQKKKPNGCGCSHIPFSIIIAILGGGYWWFSQKVNLDISKVLPKNYQINIPILNRVPTADSPTTPTNSSPVTPTNSSPTTPSRASTSNLDDNNKQASIKTITPPSPPLPPPPWEKKVIRGIYLSRYQVTNNADEQPRAISF